MNFADLEKRLLDKGGSISFDEAIELTNTPNDNVTSMLNITTRSKIHNSIFLNI